MSENLIVSGVELTYSGGRLKKYVICACIWDPGIMKNCIGNMFCQTQ